MALGAVLYLAFLAARRRWISAEALRQGWQGGAAFGLTASLMFTALQETTVANATVITALQPLVIMALAGRMFGERFRSELLRATLVTLGGVAFVIFGSTSTPAWSPRGDALAFGALVAWVWYFPASKRAREHLDALTYQTVVLVVGLPDRGVLRPAHDRFGRPTHRRPVDRHPGHGARPGNRAPADELVARPHRAHAGLHPHALGAGAVDHRRRGLPRRADGRVAGGGDGGRRGGPRLAHPPS